MNIAKVTRDWMVKVLNGPKVVPIGLVELHRYFKNYGPIAFSQHKENGDIIAVSENFQYGSIITAAKNEQELDASIKDAILTSFEVPSVYAKEAGLARQTNSTKEAPTYRYAAA